MMTDLFANPYRPTAGHTPPHLAGRVAEQDEFRKLLGQSVIIENIILSGLRGVGKTVLLNHMKPVAQKEGWLWTGEDCTEEATLNEQRIVTRIITDLSSILSPLFMRTQVEMPIGFSAKPSTKARPLGYTDLQNIFDEAPGLNSDKLKAVLRYVSQIAKSTRLKGIVFAYDEAQNLADKAEKDQYPLSLLLDVFQSLQRDSNGFPFLLVLTGLPTLFPKLISARTYSERMFHRIFLSRLSDDEAREAITVPLERENCPVKFTDYAISKIIDMSGGYPYFIQFICKEVFDIYLAQKMAHQQSDISMEYILKKLDQDFFSARWNDVTDKQRIFMYVIAQLKNCENEFTASEIARISADVLDQPYSVSGATRYLTRLSDQGLVYKNRRGKYQFAVPLLSEYIKRQISEETNLPRFFPTSSGR